MIAGVPVQWPLDDTSRHWAIGTISPVVALYLSEIGVSHGLALKAPGSKPRQSARPRAKGASTAEADLPSGTQWLACILRLQVGAGMVLALILSANAVESAAERCERGSSVDAAIEACSSVIQTDNDRHRVAMAYFNRAGWHSKKDEISRAAADLSEAIGFEPDFAAALTKRGLLEERLNDLKSARADFAAVLKLPTTNNLSVWAHAMARERLAATEAAAAKAAAASALTPPRKHRIVERLLRSFGGGRWHRFFKNATRSHRLSSNFPAQKAK